MNIPRENILFLLLTKRKTFDEIARIYGVSPNYIKKLVRIQNIPFDRTKKCGSCGAGDKKIPLEGSGGMSFELTKD